MKKHLSSAGLLCLTAALLLASAVPSQAGTAKLDRSPTFTRDVAPILNNRCVSCHQPDQIGPMSLRTYDEARPWAKSIAKNVKTRTMPPWHADPGFGPFKNDRSLTAEEIETLVRWAKLGAPEGDPADLAVTQEASNPAQWTLGEPDYVIELDEVEVPGSGPDLFKNIPLEVTFPEDQWIKAVEVLPGNRQVVHHVLLWLGGEDGSPQSLLGGWAAGALPDVFPQGTGKFLERGAKLFGDMHYHPIDTTQKDITRIGLYFAKDEEIEKELVNHWILNTEFEIPAGDDNYEARASYTFPQDSHIFALTPHLHYRGKDFTFTATYPDGRSEDILKVSNYDFGWQTTYQFVEPLAIPQGTRIDCVAHWDNSKRNPDNPDPTKNVRFGPESYDEMMIGFVDYTVDEGVRPKPVVSPIFAKIDELGALYPGEVFQAEIQVVEGGDTQPSAIHMPREGEGGWYVAMGNIVGRARIVDIAWTGNDFEGKAEIPGQGTIELAGTFDPDAGSVAMTLTFPDGNSGSMTGTLVKVE